MYSNFLGRGCLWLQLLANLPHKATVLFGPSASAPCVPMFLVCNVHSLPHPSMPCYFYRHAIYTNFVPFVTPASPECYTGMNGSDYRGFTSTTATGYDCINWLDDSTFIHDFKPENFPNQGLGDHRYCRNVNGARSPWCITSDPNALDHWDYCDVLPPMPSCEREVPLIVG